MSYCLRNWTILLLSLANILFAFSASAHEQTKMRLWKRSTPIPYEKIGIDTLQQSILKYELDMRYVYDSSKTYTDYGGMCLRAFYVWAKRYTKNGSLKLNVLNIPNKKDSFTDIESTENKVIKPYACFTLNDLISDSTALANLNLKYAGIWSDLVVDLTGLIPDSDSPTGWRNVEFQYTFRWKYNGTIDMWENQLNQTPSRYFDTDGFMAFSTMMVFDFELKFCKIEMLKNDVIDISTHTNSPPTSFF